MLIYSNFYSGDSGVFRARFREEVKEVIQIRLKKGETVDRALKRMKKILDKEGIMKQIRANRYFEKPSEKKRRKSERARIRNNSRRNSAM